MIVRPKPSAIELFFIWRLSILARVTPQLGTLLVFSTAVTLFNRYRPAIFHTWTVAPYTLLGIALSIFLGFRNSACYERWWEARRALGSMLGEMRSFARVALTAPGATSAERQARRERLVRGAIGYMVSLTAYLQGVPVSEAVRVYVADPAAAQEARPDRMLHRLAEDTAGMLGEGEIGEQVYRLLDDRLTAFAGVQSVCERIRSTPTPFSYTLLLHRTAYAFCFLLPFGLVSTMGWGTPVLCTIIAYAFFGLDALGDELEEPFGTSVNALPLNAMARAVEISLLEALGEADIPKPLEPVDSVLW